MSSIQVRASDRCAAALESGLQRHGQLAVVALVVVGLGIAWSNRFIQDDAFISFHYARQLVAGNGLTWFGERVEGYTNFLWVIWIAAGLKVGADPVGWSWVGGAVAFTAALVLTWGLGVRCLGRRTPAAFAVLVLITNYSFTSYATGGLETMAQTALLTGSALVVLDLLDHPSASRCALWSLLAAAALLTRLDSAVALVILSPVWIAVRRRPRVAEIVGVAPAPLIVGAWFAWKIAFYGSLLPNTYFARVGGELFGPNGLAYLARFLHWYALWPFVALGLVGAARRQDAPSALLVGWLLLWWLYVFSVGGDFMEFRLLVPALPPLALLVALGLHDVIGGGLRRPVVASLIGLTILAVASARHARSFTTWTRDYALDSIPALSTCYGLYRDGNWSRIGLALRRELDDGSGVRLAMHPVGAIPYYSEFRTVDMWGLNDPFIARQGNRVPSHFRRPGHRRHAPLAYLRRRGVHLVLGHPELVAPGTLRRR